MIVKLIMLRFYFLIPIVLLFLNCLVAQENPSSLEGIDLRIISMHYDWANLARYEDKNKEVVINQNEDRVVFMGNSITCLLYTSPSPRDMRRSRMPSSA